MFELVDSAPASAVIKVIGAGGGGGNAVNHMAKNNIEGVEFICANTDAQALKNIGARTVLQLGTAVTKGLGAGANLIGEPLLEGGFTAIDAGFGVADGINRKSAKTSHQRDELRVQLLDVGLDVGSDRCRQRRMRMAIDLVGAGVQEGVVEPRLRIGHRLVDVHSHYPDGAHLGGASEPQTVSGTGNGVGG